MEALLHAPDAPITPSVKRPRTTSPGVDSPSLGTLRTLLEGVNVGPLMTLFATHDLDLLLATWQRCGEDGQATEHALFEHVQSSANTQPLDDGQAPSPVHASASSASEPVALMPPCVTVPAHLLVPPVPPVPMPVDSEPVPPAAVLEGRLQSGLAPVTLQPVPPIPMPVQLQPVPFAPAAPPPVHHVQMQHAPNAVASPALGHLQPHVNPVPAQLQPAAAHQPRPSNIGDPDGDVPIVNMSNRIAGFAVFHPEPHVTPHDCHAVAPPQLSYPMTAAAMQHGMDRHAAPHVDVQQQLVIPHVAPVAAADCITPPRQPLPARPLT